jgi:formate C-acetyltransferase
VGDSAFLQGPTPRTRGLWESLQPLLAEEREKGILDVSQVPSSILAHGPGYIDKDREIIVGLQTNAPLKRVIMPFGGWRVVAASLKAYGYEPDARLAEIFSKYRKTHNDGVFDAYTAEIRKARSSSVSTSMQARVRQVNGIVPTTSGGLGTRRGARLCSARTGKQ